MADLATFATYRAAAISLQSEEGRIY